MHIQLVFCYIISIVVDGTGGTVAVRMIQNHEPLMMNVRPCDPSETQSVVVRTLAVMPESVGDWVYTTRCTVARAAALGRVQMHGLRVGSPTI